MGIALGLLAAVAYGASDFAAGLASRWLAAGPVSTVTTLIGVLTAFVGVLLFSGVGPRASALEWGALSGVGNAFGTLALYQGLSVSRMTAVATPSAVLTAVIPVIVGLALGNQLSVPTALGIAIAVPAIALVSWHPEPGDRRAARSGLLYGILAGLGFALLFIALDQAGTRSGAWPLVPGELVTLALLLPFGYRGLRAVGRPAANALALTVGAGILSGTANLLFLAATGHGELAIVAVLTALYPAVTVLLARALLAEHWTRIQAAGLLTSAAAIVLVTAG
jgi:drug/metabolite transporter (DMT)-like permease